MPICRRKSLDRRRRRRCYQTVIST